MKFQTVPPTITAASVLAVVCVLTSCSTTDRQAIETCARNEKSLAQRQLSERSEPRPLLATLALLNTSVVLVRLEPVSLRPISRPVILGEYHRAWAPSPDGSQAAFGISAPGQSRRIGIRIVDLEKPAVVREIDTGIAAETLQWLEPRRLVAGLLRGGTVLLDPVTGRTLQRWPHISGSKVTARFRDSAVILAPIRDLPSPQATSVARLVAITADGQVRSVTLDRIRIGGLVSEHRAGLVVDSARKRAYVISKGATVAEVDLQSMRPTYHSVETFSRSADEQAEEAAGRDVRAEQRQLLRLPGRRLLVAGQTLIDHGRAGFGISPGGAWVIDLRNWSSCQLDPDGTFATLTERGLLVWGPGPPLVENQPGVGLRGYGRDGRRLFHLLKGEQIWNVTVNADDAYVRTPGATYVVDLNAGRIAGTIKPPVDLVDAIGS